MDRYYSIETVPGLFGQFGVERHWGRRGTTGQTRTDWFETLDAALAKARIIVERKRRKGYR